MQLILEKEAGKKLSDDKIHDQLTEIMRRILSAGRDKRGWTAELTKITVQGALPYKYRAYIDLNNSSGRSTIEQEFENIIKIVANAGKVTKWVVESYEDVKGNTKSPGEALESRGFVGYAPLDIPKNWRKYFEQIYERDDQIEIVVSAIEAAIKSNWRHRFHVVLWGPPACGKTEIVRAVKNMVGDNSVLEFDATSTTQAGAIKELSDRDELPRILAVEELEKADDNSMRWLLGVLDFRAEIRKTTARAQIQRDVRMLCISTVNDYEQFNKVMFGALASRFAHKVYCPRPTDTILRMILKREIETVGGKLSWIDPTLKYAKKFDEPITDPRRITAIALSGRDELLTGKFQKKLDAVHGPENAGNGHHGKREYVA